jgi:NADH-quinone oxidoreductase subunit L
MENALFHLFAGMTLICALMVVASPFSRNPVTRAMFLVLTMVRLAALFVLLNAFFLAAIQLLVYAEAVMVLFLFIIMLLDLKEEERRKFGKFSATTGTVAVIAFAVVLLRQIHGAGSVISALSHVQDIWKMGGLSRKMPTTFWTFLVGAFALCGLPPCSGFYCKDAILAQAAQHNSALFMLGLLLAALTAFCTFRLVLVVFEGRSRTEIVSHAKESLPVMTQPMRLLAVFSLIVGWIGIEWFVGRAFPGGPESGAHTWLHDLFAPFVHAPLAAVSGLGAAIMGLVAAFALYARAEDDPLPRKLGFLARWMRDRFYFDELYAATAIRLHDAIARAADWCDRWIIAGLIVRGRHGTTELIGRALRLAQTGGLQTYTLLFTAGVVFVLCWFFGS